MRGFLLFAVLAGAAFSPSLCRRTPRGAPVAPPPVPRRGEAEYREGFLPGLAGVPSVHSVTLAARPAGGLFAAWFGGSREGAADVAIYGAEYDARSGGGWGEPVAIATRRRLQRDLVRRVAKIGNPTLHAAPDGSLRLFLVTVGAGGWSGSAVNVMDSPDGVSWSRARRCVSTPYFDLGTLVRNPPVAYDDGSLGLPVSRELFRKRGELLHIDGNGAVVGKSRIARGAHQPAVAVSRDGGLAAFLRAPPPTGAVSRAESSDGGRTWSAPEDLDLPNPASGIAVLRLDAGRLLLAYNNSRRRRNDLSLAISDDDGRSWRRVRSVERSESPDDEFSYPSFAASGGLIHLVYTWNRQRLRHVTFNLPWLERQL